MTRNELALAISAGVALAIPYSLYALRARHAKRVFGVGLVVAAAAYVVFAAVRASFDGFLIESCGVLLFAGIAALGVRGSAHVLALGWLGHILWDLLLHPAFSYAPWWYPVACIGFDLVVAGAIFARSMR